MPSVTGAAFSARDFRRLPAPPFNPLIRISQAVAWFNGRLCVGGGRGPLRQRGREAGDVTLGAEIACYDPAAESWSIVYRSPLDEDGEARDRSVRAFAVFQGASDKAPVLYAAVGSMKEQVLLLRSEDGTTFAECGPPGLGQGAADIAAVRCLFEHDGHLYTTPLGMNYGRGWADDNMTEMPLVLRTTDPSVGAWEAVSPAGFGDPANESINELCAFNGTIYAATLNRKRGFQLWRQAGEDWVKVLERGAERGPASPMPTSMIVFDGALYIGTGVQRQPGEGADSFGPFAAELIRVHPDDSWDLIAGQTRVTPAGLKQPLSGAGPGFDDPFVQAFWRMEVHDGQLYVGGADWRFWPTYLGRGPRRRTDLSPVHLEWLREMTESWSGDYGFWRSGKGQSFEAITLSGLGDNPSQYGLRELLSTPAGLFAVPAARQGGEGGGVEVWLAEGVA
ncbi:hypothetical protein ACXN5S_16510 [Pseudoroseicyclus sp. H15]